MKVADLRRAILQAAVQGKLVPQDKNDEPVSELLKRIQAEKAVLIKEGKLKKGKPLLPITDEEIPHDLPDGWVWCRLCDLGSFSSGKTPDMTNPLFWDNGTVLWVSSKDMKSKYLNDSKMKITELAKENMTVYPAGTLLMVVRSGILKRMLPICILTVESTINQDIKAYSLFDSDMSEYVYFMLKGLEKTILDDYTKQVTTVDSLRFEEFSRVMPVPLPPADEQRRIVSKVSELMVMCDELEAAEKELDSLEEHFFDYLPKSILQAAVQGKLVPQDKNDEPASEFLKRIQAEKAVLIKEGKLKKEKPLPPISEDEIPYDLPDGWAWCRLGSLIQLLSGRDLEPRLYNDLGKGIPYITGASALIDNKIDVVRWTEHPVTVSTLQDILLSCKGTVGKIVHNTIGDCHIARQIMAIRTPYMDINKDYLAIVLKTFVPQLVDQAKSMIPGISRDDVLNLLYPIPPLVEQQRIVAKVDELMAMCDELKRVADQPISHDNVIPFPAVPKEKDEPIAMAARGEVEGMSDQAKQAIEDLFGEDE